jgi:amino acid transporter
MRTEAIRTRPETAAAESEAASRAEPHASRGALGARRLSLLPLVAVMYLVVSGGAYGLEDAVRIAGARITLLLCLIVPLTLSVPTALMAAELTALMPVEGGFYFWVKDALGPFAGFLEAYLTMLYTAVDMAIYPVMFAAYLSFLLPMGSWGEIALGVALVWLSGALNLMGVRPVGRTSVALTVILLAPFAALVIVGAPRLIHWQISAGAAAGGGSIGALGAALSVVIWNFSGWENLSVVAAEIDNPRRNYVRAMALAVPLVCLGYVLPLMVATSGSADTSAWRVGFFAHVGRQIAGPMVGSALALGGALCAFSVFEAAMLWVSRMPFVLARERYLPEPLADIWLRTATPWKSIVLCCIVFSVLVPLGFVTLVVLDTFFYMSALVLEMAALVRLRRARPDRNGHFVIGWGNPALYAVALLPILTWLVTFTMALDGGHGRNDFLIALILGIASVPIYGFLKSRYGGPSALAAATERPGSGLV